MPATTRRSRPKTKVVAPSWRTVFEMEQARWIKTARLYVTELPSNLARLADCTTISSHDAKRLAAWCADNNRPLAQAGHRKR